MKYPEIKIKYARFLDPIFIGWIESQGKYKDWKIPTKKAVIKRIENYKKLWDKNGDKILKEMTAATGMTFKRGMIPVYVVSGNPRPFSDPLVIKSGYKDNDFINVLTHELIHCLFVDNGIPVKKVYSIFPHSDETTSAHIPVYALMKHIFKAIKKPVLYERKYEKNPANIAYETAMDIVEHTGYESLVKLVKVELTRHKGVLG